MYLFTLCGSRLWERIIPLGILTQLGLRNDESRVTCWKLLKKCLWSLQHSWSVQKNENSMIEYPVILLAMSNCYPLLQYSAQYHQENCECHLQTALLTHCIFDQSYFLQITKLFCLFDTLALFLWSIYIYNTGSSWICSRKTKLAFRSSKLRSVYFTCLWSCSPRAVTEGLLLWEQGCFWLEFKPEGVVLIYSSYKGSVSAQNFRIS